MKSIFILYLPGYAGNFLVRLFSLSPETVPQIPIPLLNELAKNFKPLPDLDRVESYSFSRVLSEFDNWQSFHRHWPDFKEHQQFKLLNMANGCKYSTLIHAIHPHEFIKYETELYSEPNFSLVDDAEYYYVDLDLSNYGDWYVTQKEKLGFENRDNESYADITDRYNMLPINLTTMLDSESAFLTEYYRVCLAMKITATEADAITLYRDWKKVRLPC